MKLEIVEGYREKTNEVMIGLCFTQRGEVVETLSVLISAKEVA